jgi:hypothetical protein
MLLRVHMSHHKCTTPHVVARDEFGCCHHCHWNWGKTLLLSRACACSKCKATASVLLEVSVPSQQLSGLCLALHSTPWKGAPVCMNLKRYYKGSNPSLACFSEYKEFQRTSTRSICHLQMTAALDHIPQSTTRPDGSRSGQHATAIIAQLRCRPGAVNTAMSSSAERRPGPTTVPCLAVTSSCRLPCTARFSS